MKTMKVALLATVAFASVTVGARADDTAALKAELEALNARVAQLEAAPAVPTGYSLLTIADGKSSPIPGVDVLNRDALANGTQATIIGILPTADMPASTTIEWKGMVRAAILYETSAANRGGDSNIDLRARGELNVKGKTDTAVGEVGATINFRVDADPLNHNNTNNVYANNYWGWWAMTPELTLGGGRNGTLANNSYSTDSQAETYYTDNDTAFALDRGDSTQMRLSYASGPMSMAIALEDGSKSLNTDDSLGVAAKLRYSGDSMSAELAGGYWSKDDFVGVANDDVNWQINAGAQFALGDMLTWSIAGGAAKFWSGEKYQAISTTIAANLSDSVHADLGVGYKNFHVANDHTAVLAGIFYAPVSQLTIGIEGEWDGIKNTKDTTTIDLVTVFRF
jgi:hypothetical protein